jgi:hypothetical protein
MSVQFRGRITPNCNRTNPPRKTGVYRTARGEESDYSEVIQARLNVPSETNVSFSYSNSTVSSGL